MLFICMFVGCKRGLADSFAPFASSASSARLWQGARVFAWLNDVNVVLPLLVHVQGFGKSLKALNLHFESC